MNYSEELKKTNKLLNEINKKLDMILLLEKGVLKTQIVFGYSNYHKKALKNHSNSADENSTLSDSQMQ